MPGLLKRMDHVHCEGWQFAWNNPAYSDLVNLNLQYCDPELLPTSTQFHNILKTCPRLDTLALIDFTLIPVSSAEFRCDTLAVTAHPIRLNNLRVLRLNTEPWTMGHLLSQISAPALDLVSLAMRKRENDSVDEFSRTNFITRHLINFLRRPQSECVITRLHLTKM
jgi:hypothetical protein